MALLRLFRETLGCVATGLNMGLIVRRMHLIRPMKEAAIQNATHKLTKERLREHTPSWFKDARYILF